jgi:branched-chain amino acid transport system substrate-binding protein
MGGVKTKKKLEPVRQSPRSRLWWTAAVLFLSLVFVTSCQRPQAVGPTPAVQAEPGVYLQQIEKAVAERDSRKAVSLLEEFLKFYPNDPKAEFSALRLGYLYLETGENAKAYELLRTWLEQYPQSRNRARGRLYLAMSLFRLDRVKEALDLFHALAEEPEAVAFLPQIYVYLGECYLKQGQLLPALTWYVRYESGLRDKAEQKAVQKRFVQILSRGWSESTLERALAQFQEGFLADAVRYGMALAQVQGGKRRLAEESLLKIASRHLDDPLTGPIQDLLKAIAAQERPRTCTIGCLLPLTGKYQGIGSGVLDALLLGSRAFQDPGPRGHTIRLLIRDTQGNPATAARLLRELAGVQDLVGIVGPLTAEEGLLCAREAESLGVPLIALTQKEEVAKVGSFVFQNGLTMRQQVETLVDYAMGRLGVVRFAVLYPNDAYGVLARDRFRQKVAENGGVVEAAVPYAERETDFQDEIKRLVGESYWRALQEKEQKKGFRQTLEEDDQSEEAAVSSGGAPAAAASEAASGLPFEALFIPDEYRRVSLIAPHLALFDLSGVLLLGTNAWHSDRLVASAGDYVKGSLFVDGFFEGSPMPFVREFVEEFRRNFGRAPGLLEAEALDSLWMLEAAFDQAGQKTRTGVRDALEALENYPGLSGTTSFDADGCARKHLHVLTVTDNRIEEVY